MEDTGRKLDAWKRSPARSDGNFPPELKIPHISQTILSEYCNEDIDPFASGTARDSRPTVRKGCYDRHRSRTPTKHTGYHTRGRSRDRFDRDTSQPRETSYRRDGQRRRSTSWSPLSKTMNPVCDICWVRHRDTTVGCPDFIKFMNIKDFVESNPHGTVLFTRDQMVQDRKRSPSASVRRASLQDEDSESSDTDEWLLGEDLRPPRKPPDTNAKETDIDTRFLPTPDDLQWDDLIIQTIKSFDTYEIKSAIAMAAMHPLKHDKHQECVAQPRIIAAICCENESRACINKSRVSSNCGSLCSTNYRKRSAFLKRWKCPPFLRSYLLNLLKTRQILFSLKENYAIHLSTKRNVACRESYHKEKS